MLVWVIVLAVLSAILLALTLFFATRQTRAASMAPPSPEIREVIVEKEVVKRVGHFQTVPNFYASVRKFGFRPVRELAGAEAGKTAIVLGSGASLDLLDPVWLTDDPDVVVIGINQTFLKMPCDYIIRKDACLCQASVDHLAKNAPDTKLVVSLFDCGNRQAQRNEFDTGGLDVYSFDHLHNATHSMDVAPWREEWPNHLVVSYATLTSAIHLAHVLGCGNMLLLGCDFGAFEGRMHFQGYRQLSAPSMPNQNPNDYRRWVTQDCLKEHVDQLRPLVRGYISTAHPTGYCMPPPAPEAS